MSQRDYWSELPPLHGGDVNFNWEDFLNQPTLEPDLGFEGNGATFLHGCHSAANHQMNGPLQELNQPVEFWMNSGAPAQPQLGFSPYGQSSEIKFNEPESSFAPATFHSVATSEPPQPGANYPYPDNSASKPTARRYVCDIDGCEKSYVHQGDLERHIVNVHRNPSRFLCHVRRCPRGIKGRGFPRMDKLVDHLKSRKHELEHEEAAYEAAKHNPRKKYGHFLMNSSTGCYEWR